MGAAISAKENGANVLIIERDDKLGGILNQCIHNGFGLHYFHVELTGPEYADRFIQRVQELQIDVMTQTFVINITADRMLTAVSATEGIVEISAKAIVLAMGCRERTAGAIQLGGDRPAGVWTAGLAQKLCNIDGYLVGKNVVVLGSGDIGLIMARRMTYEGANVIMVCEVMPYSSGLKRNIVQCLNDYNIPLYFKTTIAEIVGKDRVEGVVIAQVDDRMQIISSTRKYVECDCVLLSVGLIPENDLVNGLGIKMSPVTTGAEVDDYRHTSVEGIFSCGNVLHVHDLVDNVSAEAFIAGASATKYAKGELPHGQSYRVIPQNGVRYALPQRIIAGEGKVKVYYRVDNIYKAPRVVVKCNGEELYSRRYMIMAPGEMESVELDKEKIVGDVVIELEVQQ